MKQAKLEIEVNFKNKLNHLVLLLQLTHIKI